MAISLEEYNRQQQQQQPKYTSIEDYDPYEGQNADMEQQGVNTWNELLGKAPGMGEASWGESAKEALLGGVPAAGAWAAGGVTQFLGDIIGAVTPDDVTFDDRMVQKGREMSALGRGYAKRVEDAGTYHNRIIPEVAEAVGGALGLDSLEAWGKESDLGMDMGSPAYLGGQVGASMIGPGKLGAGRTFWPKIAGYAGAGAPAGYIFGRAEGEDTGGAMLDAGIGAVAAGVAGPALEKVLDILAPGKYTAEQIRNLDLPPSVRSKLQYLAEDTSVNLQDIVNRAADLIDTTKQGAKGVPKEDVIRAAAMTGDTRAKNYLMQSVAKADPGVGNITREANERTMQLMDEIDPNSTIGQMLSEYTNKIDDRLYTDWGGLYTKLQEAVDSGKMPGFDMTGPLATRLKGYSRLDDSSMVNSALRKRVAEDNPYYLETVRGGSGSQFWAAVMDKLQDVAKGVGLGGDRAQILRRITKSMEKGRWNPAEFAKKLEDAGFTPEEVTKFTRAANDATEGTGPSSTGTGLNRTPEEMRQRFGNPEKLREERYGAPKPINEAEPLTTKPAGSDESELDAIIARRTSPESAAIDPSSNPVLDADLDFTDEALTPSMLGGQTIVDLEGATTGDLVTYLERAQGVPRKDAENLIANMLENYRDGGPTINESLNRLGLGSSKQFGEALRTLTQKGRMEGAPIQSSPMAGGALAGSAAGVEQNEDGSYSYDPLKGFIGATTGATLGSKGFRNKVLGQTDNGMRPGHLFGDNSISSLQAANNPRLSAGGPTRAEKLQDWSEGAEVIDTYHGTASDIKAFDPSKTSESVHNVEGIYTTLFPTDAGQYARKASQAAGGSGANILPLKAKNKNIIDVATDGLTEELVKKLGIPDYKLFELVRDDGLYDVSRSLRASRLNRQDTTEVLKEAGYTGLRDGPHYIYFDPKDLKSSFSLDFDSDTSDLIKTITGVTAGVTAASQIDSQLK